MRAKLLLLAAVGALFAGSYWGKAQLAARADARRAAPDRRERIVSLAPGLTETLYALGLDDRVVGVTRYCRFPPAAAEKPNVGGLADLDVERLVALRPTLVVLLEGNRSWQPTCDALGIDTLVVDHRTLDGLLESIRTLGRRFGAAGRAEELLADIQKRLAHVQRKLAGLPRPRVLVSVDRVTGSGGLRDVYAAGGRADLHLNALVRLAGGRNVLEGTTVDFPVVSAEGILMADPEVILDVLPSGTETDVAERLEDWQRVGRVSAVRHGRVYVLDKDRATVPGPRFVLVVEQLARLLHPEVDWDAPLEP